MLFITWNISCHSPLAFNASVGKSADRLIEVPLYITCFSLAAFKILSIFKIWDFMRPLLVHLDWHPLCFLHLYGFSPLQLGKFSVIIFSNRVSIPYYFSSPSGIPDLMLLHFMLSCHSLKLSYVFSLFSCSLFTWVFLFFFFFKLFYLFIFRERRREEKREGEKHQMCGCPSCAPPGDLACNPGMCPDWESNQ